MNPSKVYYKKIDATTNEVIRAMFIMGHTGFKLFNLYPERATKPEELGEYSEDYMKKH